MPTALLIISSISAIFACFASLHKDRIKDGHNPRVLRAIRISAFASCMVVAAALLNQHYARQQANALRTAQLRLTVLTSLSGYRVQILDDFTWLLTHSLTTKNYLDYETSRALSISAAGAIPDWQTLVSDVTRSELIKSRSAFDQLQTISRNVLMEAATYPSMVPKPLVDWATATLALEFSDLPRIIDSYHPTPQSVHYAQLTGQAVGAITGGMISSAAFVAK
ncbi:putative lipoprotein [Burkholderia sp. MSHR3999]|nr:putative lipoprotein [Burkholderia sp. MSHR3999]